MYENYLLKKQRENWRRNAGSQEADLGLFSLIAEPRVSSAAEGSWGSGPYVLVISGKSLAESDCDKHYLSRYEQGFIN